VEARAFSDLSVVVDDYLGLQMGFLERNGEKCRLERAQ
jgi:hypothetical protein